MFSTIQKENPTDDSQAAELANFASTLEKYFSMILRGETYEVMRLGMKQAKSILTSSY